MGVGGRVGGRGEGGRGGGRVGVREGEREGTSNISKFMEQRTSSQLTLALAEESPSSLHRTVARREAMAWEYPDTASTGPLVLRSCPRQ